MSAKYVAALDVGTSNIKCQIFNEKGEVVGKAVTQVKLHIPHPGHVEILAEELWESIQDLIKNAVNDSGIHPSCIASMGISTQRGSFVTWDKKTGEYFHNFITWKDLRANDIVDKWNKSLINTVLHKGAYVLYTITRKKRFLAASAVKFNNMMVMPRFSWVLKNNPRLKQAVAMGTAAFGTLDTWLLRKLTGKNIHVTDYSSASGTAMFDPFTKNWAESALRYFGLSPEVLPKVVDTAGYFGDMDKTILGVSIPIMCSMADQSASLFGSCCFKPGDAKLTMGTGTFFNINTGDKPHVSTLGLYPLIAWKVGCNMVHMVEGNNGDTGTLILWALSSGLADKPEDTGDMALSVSDSDGVYFIPSFTGLGAPVNDSTAAAGFIGVKMTTKKEHLVRSVLEAISFRSAQLSRCIKQETNYTFDKIRIDGGVSQNNFVGQLISDMTGLTLERTSSAEVSARGCAFLAGLTSGVWQSHEEVAALCHGDNLFVPRDGVGKIYGEEMQKWESAVNRFKEWYKKEKTPKFANISKFCCNRKKKSAI